MTKDGMIVISLMITSMAPKRNQEVGILGRRTRPMTYYPSVKRADLSGKLKSILPELHTTKTFQA